MIGREQHTISANKRRGADNAYLGHLSSLLATAMVRYYQLPAALSSGVERAEFDHHRDVSDS